MKNALRIWRGVLQLDEVTLQALKQSRHGMRYASLQFLVVTLLAGLGIWLGLPAVLQKPLLSERFERVESFVRQLQTEFAPAVFYQFDLVSEEQLLVTLAASRSQGESFSGSQLAGLIRQAGLTGSQVRTAMSARSEDMGAGARSDAEPALAALEARIDDGETIPPAEIERVLDVVGMTAAEVVSAIEEQVQSGGNGRGVALLPPVSLPGKGIPTVLARQVLLSERVRDSIAWLGLEPRQVARIRMQVDAAQDAVLEALTTMRGRFAVFEPPLGTRVSRTANVFGAWVSTPLVLLEQWVFDVLLLLIVTKAIGGRGTLRQHLTAVLLATAPLFLLFFTYIPTVAPAMPASLDFVFNNFGQILALVAAVWAGAILVKSLSVAHEFGLWRAAGAIALTWFAVNLFLYSVALLEAEYILFG